MNINYIIVCLYICSSFIFSQNLTINQPIDAIKFSGASSLLAKEALQSLTLQTLPNSLLSLQKLKFDINQIYQTGFFSSVTTETLFIQNKNTLFIRLIENSSINTIDVITDNDRIKTIIYDSFSSILDSPLNALTLEQLKQSALLTIQQAGFDFLDLTNIVYDKASQTLKIFVTEATIESITFIGLNNISTSILLREMSQQKGNIFNSLDLRKDRERLIRLGYFNSISTPEFSIGSSPNLIKISFTVVEKKLNKISIGLEQDQIRYYGFISNRRHNFLLKSDLISLKTQVQFEESSIKFNRYSFGYSQPWMFNRYDISGSIGFYNLEKQEVINNQTTRSIRQGQTIGIKIPFSDNFSLSHSLKLENISRFYDSDNIEPYAIHSYEIIALYDTIRHNMNPKQGSRLYFNIEQGNHLGFITIGGLSFTRLSSSVSYYHSISSKLVLASRLKGGIFYPIQESINTFENEYFIIGGSRSLRGYNESYSPFSGRRHILVNLELRYFLSSHLQSVFFIDYGHAFNHQLLLKHFNTGYGMGLRYHTPIGPIRIDFAQGESSFYIHLGLGHIF